MNMGERAGLLLVVIGKWAAKYMGAAKGLDRMANQQEACASAEGCLERE